MKMDEGQIKGIIENEIDNSIGYIDTETTDQRSKALEYYLRYPYGNEVEGRSQIVTGEVAEAIDAARLEGIRLGLEAAAQRAGLEWSDPEAERATNIVASTIRALDPDTIAREAALDQLTREAQAQGMGYDNDDAKETAR